jgi:hypothetical protein
LELNELKSRVEMVRSNQKVKSSDAKTAEIALLWDFVSDIAENSGIYERDKAKYLLGSGIKSVAKGKSNLADKLVEASQNGILELEKIGGKLIAKAGPLKVELDINKTC